MPEAEGNIFYRYKFHLRDGRSIDYTIELDPETLDIARRPQPPHPDWTRLGFHQCPGCPLKDGPSAHCPIAVNLASVVDFFRESLSYEDARVVIETRERTYVKDARLHEGLSSLVGIYMVTSGCPVMEKFKPMVRFHLPFASEDETKYRAFSMFMLAKYFMHRSGKPQDWDMKGLAELYEQVRVVNKGFCERLSSTHVRDASLNALVNLDCFAMSVSFSLDQGFLDEIERLFVPYTK